MLKHFSTSLRLVEFSLQILAVIHIYLWVMLYSTKSCQTPVYSCYLFDRENHIAPACVSWQRAEINDAI
jgi:hypothetical protein